VFSGTSSENEGGVIGVLLKNLLTFVIQLILEGCVPLVVDAGVLCMRLVRSLVVGALVVGALVVDALVRLVVRPPPLILRDIFFLERLYFRGIYNIII
tara:strand:+ start:223 stop:516 length:294 start_codon:yes stop_codon:yes gene_type:complete